MCVSPSEGAIRFTTFRISGFLSESEDRVPVVRKCELRAILAADHATPNASSMLSGAGAYSSGSIE
jgi:hypothetical protein